MAGSERWMAVLFVVIGFILLVFRMGWRCLPSPPIKSTPNRPCARSIRAPRTTVRHVASRLNRASRPHRPSEAVVTNKKPAWPQETGHDSRVCLSQPQLPVLRLHR